MRSACGRLCGSKGRRHFCGCPGSPTRWSKSRRARELHVDFEQLTYIDHACLELLMTWEKQHEATGGSLVLDWDSLHARFKSPRRPMSPAA